MECALLPDIERYSSPFSADDIRSLHREASGCAGGDCRPAEPDDGWEVLKETDKVKLWRKKRGSPHIQVLKTEQYFHGIPKHAVLQLMTNISIRQKWDSSITYIDVLEDKPDCKLLYWYISTSLGFPDLDMLQYMTYGIDENMVMYVLYKSATHRSRPTKQGIIRMETRLLGHLIFSDKANPTLTVVVSVIETDLRCWTSYSMIIPQSLVNSVLSRVALTQHSDLSTYYHEVYKKEC